MTVGDLQNELRSFPPETPVILVWEEFGARRISMEPVIHAVNGEVHIEIEDAPQA